ncbi:MAG: class I SAM-dependent methyltransferase [Ignavibacteria bacterium]
MSNCTYKTLFPLSSKYDSNWIRKHSLGENVLYNLETLSHVLEFNTRMKVLDLGCGKAISAIFLAREFGLKVWAIDPKINPSDNFNRIKDMGVEDLVVPLKLDARKLPFPKEYFDIILAVDSFMYYGTDIEYTRYVSSFLKKGGKIGIVDICQNFGNNSNGNGINKKKLNFLHSLEWWFELFQTSEILNVEIAEIVPENSFIRREYVKDVLTSNREDIIAEELSIDTDENINVFRMVAVKY